MKFVLYDPCFEAEVYFLCPADSKNYARLCQQFCNYKEDGQPFPQARCQDAEDDTGIHVIVIGLERWDRSAESAGMLAHECLHATQFILEHRDITLSDTTAEVFAYLLDSLVRRATEILNRKERNKLKKPNK